MSAQNKEEILLTFDELLQLENGGISACVTKYSALSICEDSSAPPTKIYNLWVQKLLRSYNSEEFTINDWKTIIGYLTDVLQEFAKNLNASDDTSCKELEQWLLDSQDLLKWMETIVNTLDFSVLGLVMIFVLEVIITTCKFANKKNMKILCNIQHLVVTLTMNFLYKMPIKDDNELKSFNKIASSLCEVGSIIFSADIKTSIETWRTVVKLSEKLYNCNKNSSLTKNAKSITIEKQWNEKAILGIFEEVNVIIKLCNQNPINNDLLHIAQFYLKILRLLIYYSKEIVKTFPAIKQFIEIYAYCQHEMENNENPKIESSIHKPLFDIFSQIYAEDGMAEVVFQHLKYDADHLKSCNLAFNYLKFCIENYITNRSSVAVDSVEVLKIYNCFVEGPSIFIDKDKYAQLLETFVILTILDCTNTVHKKLCQFVVDAPWIRAYTSMEILNVYYSYILNTQTSEANGKCLEFWIAIWNKMNKSNDTYRQHKKLIEILLKTIIKNTPDAELQKCTTINNFENIETILLICGKQTEQCLQYLHTNLAQNLKKMQERRMNVTEYKELLNLIEICISKPQLLNDFLRENLLDTLTLLLSLPAFEVQKCQEFVNSCLRYFSLQKAQQKTQKLLNYLMDHEQQCCNIQNVFLVKFLLKQRPQSTKLLEVLKTSCKTTSTIISLIDSDPSTNQPIDLQIFKDLHQISIQSSNLDNELEQAKKKPRLDKGNFSNIKFILNDLNTNTQKLLNFPRSSFDDNDFDIMRNIKYTIEKCLTN